MYDESSDAVEWQHLLRWQRITLASGVIPLMIVGLGDLHGWAAAPFLLAGTTGFAVSAWQLWGPLVGRGERPSMDR